MGQYPQFPPQVDLPFFLSFRITAITVMTTARSTRLMRIVPRFALYHASITVSSFLSLRIQFAFTFTLVVSLVASL